MIDTAAMTIRGTVGTGSGGPHGVVIDTSGTRAWVTNTYDNTVSVIDLPSRSIVATIAVGTGPSGGVSYTSRPPAASGTTTATLDIPAQSPSVQDHTAHH